eukprot:gb/GECG01014067.1/.p1 GENE.gb/GECG01014067.1/~~gb/GECG01014067.1/.p1  ORF type:complete len:225 (+),score=48.97 gb/GECG01014067.1/:1-675(+)
MADNSASGEQLGRGNTRSTDKTARGRRGDAPDGKRLAAASASNQPNTKRRKTQQENEQQQEGQNYANEARSDESTGSLNPPSLQDRLLKWLDNYIDDEKLTVSDEWCTKIKKAIKKSDGFSEHPFDSKDDLKNACIARMTGDEDTTAVVSDIGGAMYAWLRKQKVGKYTQNQKQTFLEEKNASVVLFFLHHIVVSNYFAPQHSGSGRSDEMVQVKKRGSYVLGV